MCCHAAPHLYKNPNGREQGGRCGKNYNDHYLSISLLIKLKNFPLTSVEYFGDIFLKLRFLGGKKLSERGLSHERENCFFKFSDIDVWFFKWLRFYDYSN
jgi:hypothetical protein